MNKLDFIRAFANPQLTEIDARGDIATKNGEAILPALKSLVKTDEWLADRSLVERVVLRLESFEPRSAEERARTAAAYMKIIGPQGLRQPVPLGTIQVKISDQKTVNLPRKLLMAESAVFERQLSNGSVEHIDLSGQASEKGLTSFVAYLTNGMTDLDLDTNENSIELLLLAKKYGLTELAMECLECVLDPENEWVNMEHDRGQISNEERCLRNLLEDARASSITISLFFGGVAHVKMQDGSKEEQWRCLEKLHDFMPITHLELTKRKNLNHLQRFVKYNPGIVSLDLGMSLGLNEEYLEALSHDLTELVSLSIRSAPIETIPQVICERVTTLNFSRCHALKRVVVNAREIEFSNCEALTEIEAPNAVDVICRANPFLTSLVIPNASTLECRDCLLLAVLEAPNASIIDCSSCRSLVRVVAPRATMLNCSSCLVLENIIAPNVVTLNCRACSYLTAVITNAQKLDCSHCFRLESIVAPNAVTLDCSVCNLLISIITDAKELDCSNCYRLENIVAPNAVRVQCLACDNLESISAPVVESLDCSGCLKLTGIVTNAKELRCYECDTLEGIEAVNAQWLECYRCPLLNCIDAPNALMLDCVDCPGLTSLVTNATELVCGACCNLVSLVAPNVEALNCRGCYSLTSEIKSELFKTVRRNILKTCSIGTDELEQRLLRHFDDARGVYGLQSAIEDPLNQWLVDALRFVVPADFASEEEKSKCVDEIDLLQERLLLLAASEGGFQGDVLSWFSQLKKLTSLQQRVIRIIWFGCILASTTREGNPLEDPDALPTLKAIGDLADPFLQAGATWALLMIYDAGSFHQKEVWKALKKDKPAHLLLLCLFFAQGGLQRGKADELLKDLDARYYKDYKVFYPILEIGHMLFRDHSISPPERERILTMILKAPEKIPGENAKDFSAQINTYRIDQARWMTACRDLLLFERGRDLVGVRDVKRLLDSHVEACLSVFGVKERLSQSFVDTFKSERCPNALFTYAARLQTLSADDKNLLTALLGEFINGHLEGRYPDNRYNLNVNPHLKMVFGGNKRLLEKWREPLDIDLAARRGTSQDSGMVPGDRIRAVMKNAIEHKHLGEDQAELYPLLVRALGAEDPKEIQPAIEGLQGLLDATREQIASSPLAQITAMKRKLSNLSIQFYGLKMLDPEAELPALMKNLELLLNWLPERLEFTHDMREMYRVLMPAKASNPKWSKLQITEAWEDSLLMGTEVSNSCQRIDGDPKVNKCLLAYILDGKNKLMIVRDTEGKIAARSVLRILWDCGQGCPVLYMENIYTRTHEQALSDLILEGCVAKAKSMGVPLVASAKSYPNGRPYKGVLDAFGGPAPYEYVDALYGIQIDGVFSIPASNIIYMPQAESSSAGDLKPERGGEFIHKISSPRAERNARVH